MSEVVVKMNNITKEFPGVKALDNVNLELGKGEVHVLLGENGAGKSTLMKILSGVHNPTHGNMEVEGKPYTAQNTKEAQEKGITMIFQELNLVKQLTVAENIFLGRAPQKGPHIDWKQMNLDTKELLDSLEVDIRPDTEVRSLGVAQMQMVEIAKALSFKSKVIIMDEPTAALTDKEIKQLFESIERLKKSGVAIVYISHRMEEIMEIGDIVTVMRDGNYVGTVKTKDTDIEKLIQMMVGRTLDEKFPKEFAKIGKERLKVVNLNQKGMLKDISFNVKAGEIVGFAGLMGAGRTELMRAIFGADPSDGDIYVDGEKVNIKNPRDAISHSIGFLTEDRKHQGLVLKLGVRENTTLSSLEKVCSKLGINLKAEQDTTRDMIKSLDIRTPHMNQKVQFLSGGNQQKVVLAKWLTSDSQIIIFDEPTRGIDVGAKVEIYKIMNELTKNGCSIIMISSELPEVLGMSDRIYVMHQGTIAGELSSQEASQEKIMALATGGR